MENPAEEQQWMKGVGNNPHVAFVGKRNIWDAQRRGKAIFKAVKFLEEMRKAGKTVFPEFLRRKMPDGTSPMLLGDWDLKLQAIRMKK